nr:hypothetical protein Iba_chr14eCG6530 [Ipomoea batatas]
MKFGKLLEVGLEAYVLGFLRDFNFPSCSNGVCGEGSHNLSSSLGHIQKPLLIRPASMESSPDLLFMLRLLLLRHWLRELRLTIIRVARSEKVECGKEETHVIQTEPKYTMQTGAEFGKDSWVI